jgi:hypothetical protein
MARIRTIKPDFFRHEGLYEAERKCGLPIRIAFAGIWTAADREGRFRWQPRALKLDCLPYDDVDFELILNALCDAGFIVKYQGDETDSLYGYIPAWNKHQHINQREAQSILPAPTSANTCTHITAHGEGKGREGKGREGKEIIRAVAPATRPNDRFDEFWKVYPKRDGANPKAPARKKFLAAVKSGIDPGEIIAAAKRSAEEARSKGQIGTPYVPQAMTWLGQQRWGDYEPPSETPQPQGFYAAAETRELDAWDEYRKRTMGKSYPRDTKGGWNFPTQWPPDEQPTAARA